MKVLVVCSGNSGQASPFVLEQIEELEKLGMAVELFLIRGKGVRGYLSNIEPLRERVRNGAYDLLHAHLGISAILAVLQRITPVVITFHGSDIAGQPWQNIISSLASVGAAWRIFVTEALYKSIYVKPSNRYSIIPMGVNLSTFKPESMLTARKKIGLMQRGKYVLFSSSFDRVVKNYPLAKTAMDRLDGVELVELKDYTRSEVCTLMNACNVVLMTSHSEGSPQFIKEAMACNRPIVSVDVGDVHTLIGSTEGCYICSYDPDNVAENLVSALNFADQTDGRQRISRLAGDKVAKQVYEVYQRVIAD